MCWVCVCGWGVCGWVCVWGVCVCVGCVCGGGVCVCVFIPSCLIDKKIAHCCFSIDKIKDKNGIVHSSFGMYYWKNI